MPATTILTAVVGAGIFIIATPGFMFTNKTRCEEADVIRAVIIITAVGGINTYWLIGRIDNTVVGSARVIIGRTEGGMNTGTVVTPVNSAQIVIITISNTVTASGNTGIKASAIIAKVSGALIAIITISRTITTSGNGRIGAYSNLANILGAGVVIIA